MLLVLIMKNAELCVMPWFYIEVKEFCPHGTRSECMRQRKSSYSCSKLHFKKLIKPHTGGWAIVGLLKAPMQGGWTKCKSWSKKLQYPSQLFMTSPYRYRATSYVCLSWKIIPISFTLKQQKLIDHFRLDVLHFSSKFSDESLGDCSFLNTCFHMDTCKYVHYEIDYKGSEMDPRYKKRKKRSETNEENQLLPKLATDKDYLQRKMLPPQVLILIWHRSCYSLRPKEGTLTVGTVSLKAVSSTGMIPHGDGITGDTNLHCKLTCGAKEVGPLCWSRESGPNHNPNFQPHKHKHATKNRWLLLLFVLFNSGSIVTYATWMCQSLESSL